MRDGEQDVGVTMTDTTLELLAIFGALGLLVAIFGPIILWVL